MSREESELASSPGGLLARQGFYVYRDDRLIVAGGWLGMAGMHNSAPTRLARIAVEIPSGADLAWEVDVRKSTVRPPAALAGRIAELAEDVRARSERVFTHRGTPAPSQPGDQEVQAVWRQVRRLGRYEYTVNREHPLIAVALSGELGPSVAGIIRMIETTLPVDLISHKPAAAESLEGDGIGAGSTVEEVLSAFRAMLSGLPPDPERRVGLAEALARAEPFNRFPGLIREIIESDSSEEY
jgi:hypothetical protein